MFVSNLTARDMADDITTRLDAGAGNAIARIYGGTVPADADAGLGGATLLAEITLNKPSFGAASDANPGGQIALDTTGGLQDTSANATGTATFARLQDSDSLAIVQVTAGQTAEELLLNNASIQSGTTVAITSGTITVPES